MIPHLSNFPASFHAEIASFSGETAPGITVHFPFAKDIADAKGPQKKKTVFFRIRLLFFKMIVFYMKPIRFERAQRPVQTDEKKSLRFHNLLFDSGKDRNNMKQVIGVIVGILVLALIGGCWYIGQKNSLIAFDEEVNKAWSDIDTQLQRRSDLIPNLVSTVKGYAAHEEGVFTGIADARSKLAGASTISEKAEADAALTAGLGRLLAIAENYPELKANENFIRLQDELAGTENRIAVSRKRYNDQVKIYNMRIRQFPGSMFAGELGLAPRDYFEPPKGHDAVVNAPKVEF